MRAAALVCAAALALGACSSGDEDDTTAVEDDDSGCPVEPSRVEALLGYDVVVEESTASAASCRFEPVDVDAHPGAQVVVVDRRLAEDGYAAALDEIESAPGSVEDLTDGEVEGADRGWVASLGRVIHVGAAAGRRLVEVTVADGALDARAARTVAIDLAGDVLG